MTKLAIVMIILGYVASGCGTMTTRRTTNAIGAKLPATGHIVYKR